MIINQRRAQSVAVLCSFKSRHAVRRPKVRAEPALLGLARQSNEGAAHPPARFCGLESSPFGRGDSDSSVTPNVSAAAHDR